VVQGNGGASEEDRGNGFERGGWAIDVFDDEAMTVDQPDLQARGRVPCSAGEPTICSLATDEGRTGFGTPSTTKGIAHE
jgi:hypothetical protein